jgi:ketosteroid isomerase-like protein
MIENELVKRTVEHFEAIIKKDLATITGMYTESDDLLVFVEGPRWQTLGYDNVKRGWTDFVNSPILMIGCEWSEHLRSHIVGKMGFVAGIAELDLVINGEPKKVKLRGTFIFEQDVQDEWQITLEHFSQPAEDPYGIGDWLKP